MRETLEFKVTHVEGRVVEIDKYYKKLANRGTLDMRIGYLRSCNGKTFTASPEVIHKVEKWRCVK